MHVQNVESGFPSRTSRTCNRNPLLAKFAGISLSLFKPTNNTAMIVFAWMVIAASLSCCSALAEETETLKIVNWNVLYGFNHKKSVKQGANWIKKQAADVVALQELNGHLSLIHF